MTFLFFIAVFTLLLFCAVVAICRGEDSKAPFVIGGVIVWVVVAVSYGIAALMHTALNL